MQSLQNSVQLIGNLGKAPELIALTGGKSLIKLTLATNEVFSSEGERKERTNWHNIIAWGKLAENMGRFLAKGDKIAIKGRLSVKNYKDKEGVSRNFTEIVANSFHAFNGKDKKQTA